MTESTAPSAAVAGKDKEFVSSHEAAFQRDGPSVDAPQSILVRPDTNKNAADKVTSCFHFLVTFISLSF